jgi:hypothetical protein
MLGPTGLIFWLRLGDGSGSNPSCRENERRRHQEAYAARGVEISNGDYTGARLLLRVKQE